jgi:hypothetical protein
LVEKNENQQGVAEGGVGETNQGSKGEGDSCGLGGLGGRSLSSLRHPRNSLARAS